MSSSHLPIRAFQWDLARQVERLDWLLEQLPRYAQWGYQELYLHLEDAVEYPSLPGVARKDAYSYRQLERLVSAADHVGIKVVPIVNLLGHTQYLIKVPELRDLNELRHADGTPQETGQICPLHPRTLEIAEKLLRDMAPFCTAGKVHVGLDESFHLGQHPRSQREIKRIGRAAHFARYVQRLRHLTKSMDLRMGIWADMLYFLPDAIPLLPKDLIAYDWYYYPFKRHPKVELFNYAESDLAKPLQDHGIEYWGCPMNGAFRHEPLPHFHDRLDNIRSWWRRCREVKAAGFLMTSWEANRLAIETTTMVDAAAAELWLNPKQTGTSPTLAAGISRLWPRIDASALAQTLLQADQHPFTGYARWEINKSWAQATDHAEPSRYQAALEFYESSVRKWRTSPPAVVVSLKLRLYFAQRDVFVRECQREVAELRKLQSQSRSIRSRLGPLAKTAARFERALHNGREAAKAMWQLTRSARSPSPYTAQFTRDRQQLKRWQQWLTKCGQHPSHVLTAIPVSGQWQLTYEIWNFAPAVQKITLEQRIRDQWIPLKSCHTIEFLSEGADQKSSIKRHLSAPLAAPIGPNQLPALRVTISGTGQIKLRSLQVSNGIENFSADAKSWRKLGHQAPQSGWPDLQQKETYTPTFH